MNEGNGTEAKERGIVAALMACAAPAPEGDCPLRDRLLEFGRSRTLRIAEWIARETVRHGVEAYPGEDGTGADWNDDLFLGLLDTCASLMTLEGHLQNATDQISHRAYNQLTKSLTRAKVRVLALVLLSIQRNEMERRPCPDV